MEVTFLISEENILERVDEYTLYCHYLGFEPEIQVNYTSPFRVDDMNPSFGIFAATRNPNRELMWKDSGGRGDSGDIFGLVQKLFGCSRSDAVARIRSDFNLGPKLADQPKIVQHIAKNRDNADIRIRAKQWKDHDLTWWAQFNISQQLLERYRVSPLFCYWLNPKQRAPYYAPLLSYVYRVYDRYQLYFPSRPKGRKFRMDLQDEHVLGLQQLTFQTDLLIVTKSLKDVMCLRSFGYEAVSPRSENTPMPDGFFSWADKHYAHKLVLFDNDDKHRGEWYPWKKVFVPKATGSKDPSDHCRDHGPEQTSQMLRLITQ